MADRSRGVKSGSLPQSSHFDAEGRARMVDVGAKSPTRREAVARARIRMCESAFSAVREGRVAKGDVLGIARIAGIQAAKRASDWIPLCHPLPIESVEVQLEPNSARLAVDIEARVLVTAKTGVEMEAMVAASAAALTIYDMCKSLDRSMEIEFVRLARKSGGKSGVYERIE